MRIVCISDTHGQHEGLEVPDGDILIHAGDCTARGRAGELLEFLTWFRSFRHPHKLLIAGNHDWCLAGMSQVPQPSDFHYLEDSGIRIRGLNIYGSPWQPEFHDWAFNLPRGGLELRARWNAIPAGTNILITHGPPAGILDRTYRGDPAGCELLAEKVSRDRYSLPGLKLHVFGHIHESRGVVERDGVWYVNASALDSVTYLPLPVIGVFDYQDRVMRLVHQDEIRLTNSAQVG